MKDNRTSVKRSLFVSAIALTLTAALLIGTTFAWFTSTATTSVSKVTAGKLQVDIVDKNGDSLTDKTLSFKDKNGNDNILWEPGASFDLEPFKIVNKGNLAFKYSVTVSGATGDLDLLDAIDFTIKKADGTEISLADWNGVLLPKDKEPVDQTTEEVGETGYITITGKMKDEATDIYQNKSISGISIHVDATQYTYEYDSNGKDYDQNATYPGRATIDGLVGEYSTLTDAAKAWRESKGVVTSGGTFGMNTLGTVDSITWVVSGEVATGDGEGVIGNNGAGQSILGGGYFTPAVTVNNITIKGVNDAKIAKTGDSYLVSAAGKNVVYENITFVDTVRIDSNPANLTFKNCKFEAGFRMPHSATNGNVTIENCTFTGNESSGYAIFAQGNMASFKINGNTVSNCQRGINVQAGNNAVVTINGNTITNITGKTDGFTYGAAIQLTSAKTFTVTNNIVSDVAVNAFHIYKGCAADSIVISDNNISAAYLCWNDANYTNVTSSGNTLNITNAGKCVTKTAEVDSDFALN